MSDKSIIKELQVLKALFQEGLNRTSRLEEELAPVEAPARPKGREAVSKAIQRRRDLRARKMAAKR